MGAAHDVIDVNVPISTAYNQWTQFELFPQFMSGVEEVRQVDDTHLHWRISVAGVSREYDAEITEQRPDQVVAWQSTGGIDHSGRISFQSLDDHTTRITASINYATEGLTEKVADAVNAPERQLKNDLARFKQVIELRGRETGGWREEVN